MTIIYVISINKSNYDEIGWLYWIYSPIFGFFMGIAYFGTDIMLMEIMPKDVSGKIAGMKTGSQYIIKSFGLIMTGLLWSYDIQWIWYSQTIYFGISLIALLMIVFIDNLF